VSEDGTVRRYFGLDGEFTSFSLGNVRRNFLHCLRDRLELTIFRVQKNTG
jgi:hypothetical protein